MKQFRFNIVSLGILAGLWSLSSMILGASGDYFMVTDVGTSAEMIRKGNIESFSRNASVTFENPAGLYTTDKISASAFRTTFMDEVVYTNLAVSVRMPKGVLGVGYMNAKVSDIPSTRLTNATDVFLENDYPVAVSFFDYNNSLFRFAYGMSPSRFFHWGIAYSLYETDFGQTEIGNAKAKGQNIDFGCIADFDTFRFSFFARNIIRAEKAEYTIDTTQDSIDFNGQTHAINKTPTEELPFRMLLGLEINKKYVQVLGQIQTFGAQDYTKSGAVNIRVPYIENIEFSIGYKEFMVLNEIDNNTTYGVGLNLYGIQFDYAYERSDHIEYNNKHYFSAAISL